MSSTLEQILAELHSEVARKLLEKVRGGEATAADLNVARQLLKDNNITSVPKPGDALSNLVHELPFTGDEDSSGYSH